MVVKRTSKNQVTLPVALLRRLPESDYFEATVVDGTLVLRPVRMVAAGASGFYVPRPLPGPAAPGLPPVEDTDLARARALLRSLHEKTRSER